MSQAQQPKGSPREHSLQSVDFTGTLFFIQATQVGVGIFSLPRIVVEEANHNGWMAILIVGLIIQLSLFLMIALLKRFENLDLYAIMRRIFGKWIGNALGLLFALYCVATAAIVSRSYVEVLQTWLFPTTKTMLFYILLLFPCIYCATGGARVVTRFAIAATMLTLWIVFLLIKPASQFEAVYFLPLTDVHIGGLMSATFKASLSALGFELLLVIYPFVQKKEKALLASSIGTWMTTFLYLIVTIIAIGFISEGQLKNMLNPTLYMFHFVELPILERVEQLVIAAWSFLIVNSAASYMWAAGRYVHSISKWKESTCIYVFVPLLVVVGILPLDVYSVTVFETYVGTIGGIIAVGIAPLLLLFAILLKKKGSGQEGNAQGQGKAQENQESSEMKNFV